MAGKQDVKEDTKATRQGHLEGDTMTLTSILNWLYAL